MPKNAWIRNTALLRIFGVLVSIAAIGLLLQWAQKPLLRLGVLPRPQQYVALGISDSGNVAKSFMASKPTRFDFSIYNFTDHRIRQKWSVRALAEPNQNTQLAEGSAEISAGASKKITVVVLPHTPKPSEVQVQAIGQPFAPLAVHVGTPG